MPSEARQKKIMEKLNRAQKCSILGPQNLGSGGGPGPQGPPLDPHLTKLVHESRSVDSFPDDIFGGWEWVKFFLSCLFFGTDACQRLFFD